MPVRPFVVALAVSCAWVGADSLPSPLTVDPAGPTGWYTTLSLDPVGAARLAELDAALITDFPLDAARVVDLVVRRAEVFAPGARIVASTGGAEVDLPLPSEAVFVGRVRGEDRSLVVLSLTDRLTAGLIETGGVTYIISSGPAGQGLPSVVFALDAPAAEILNLDVAGCDFDEVNAPPLDGPRDGETEVGPFPCRVIDIAWETDREFYRNLFQSDAADATAYVQLLTAAISEIYTRDNNLRFRTNYISFWTGISDPWDGANTGAQLSQFVAWWNNNRQDVVRDMAHMLSGRGLGGGVAYLNGVCNGQAYAVSANLGGFFPYPLIDHSHQNWDIMVTAHEIGHNLGTGHTHDLNYYDPVVDGCGNGDCSEAFQGTIMSYCHTCAGGMSNISLYHPDRVRNVINNSLRNVGGCDINFLDNPVIVQQPQNLQACIGSPITIDVLATGDNLSYIWRRNGLPVPGAFGPALNIPSFGSVDVGAYQVSIQGDCGNTWSQVALVLPQVTVDCNDNGLCDEIDISSGSSDDSDSDGIPDECQCPADLSGSSDPNDPAYGTRDGAVDSADFFYFLDQFTAASLAVADLSGSSDPNDPAYGIPDGLVDASDFFFYMDLFVAGCP